jgi:FixJ family two-component response regulator
MVEAAGKAPLISIVDDDASVRVAITNLVSRLVLPLHSLPRRYMSSAERHKTSCIVSDIQMPGTSGLGTKQLGRSG